MFNQSHKASLFGMATGLFTATLFAQVPSTMDEMFPILIKEIAPGTEELFVSLVKDKGVTLADIERVSRLTRQVYNEFRDTIPFGSEWELSFEEKEEKIYNSAAPFAKPGGPLQTTSTVGTIKGLVIPPAKEFYGNFDAHSEFFIVALAACASSPSGISGASDEQLKELINPYLFMYYYFGCVFPPLDFELPSYELKFHNYSTFSRNEYHKRILWAFRDCGACPTVAAEYDMPVNVTTSFNEFKFEFLSTEKSVFPSSYCRCTIEDLAGRRDEYEEPCAVSRGESPGDLWLPFRDTTIVCEIKNDGHACLSEYYSYFSKITLRQVKPADPFTPIPESECEALQPGGCDDGNPCTYDFCNPAFGCLHQDLNMDAVIPQDSPCDCERQVCTDGEITSIPDDSEVLPQNSPTDCKREICKDGEIISIDDPTEAGCH